MAAVVSFWDDAGRSQAIPPSGESVAGAEPAAGPLAESPASVHTEARLAEIDRKVGAILQRADHA